MRHLWLYTIFLLAACAPSTYYNGGTGTNQPSTKSVGDQLYRALDKLTNQMVESMESENKKTVAVVEFSNLNGSVSAFGRFMAEKLISKLFETRRFKVIERSLLNKVIEEYKLSQTGITAPELAEQLGKLLGVEAIITGTITDMGGDFDVNARIIDTHSGGLLAASSVLVAKDEMVLQLLQMEYKNDGLPVPTSPGSPAAPNNEFTRLPAGVFTSAIEVDTQVLIKLDPVYEIARKEHDVQLAGNRLIWQNLGEKKHVAYIHTNGKIIILSQSQLSSQNDMEAFRNSFVKIADYIMKVNVDLNKEIRNQAWQQGITVYNYERNTYKRLMGYLRGESIIKVPKINLKQATLFVFADGWNNRVYIDGEKIARWSGRASQISDVTQFMYYGDHKFDIKQYGGTRPFFIFEFFVESSQENITITDNRDFNIRDSVPCYSINELLLPN